MRILCVFDSCFRFAVSREVRRAMSSSSPCAACKLLRRKCTPECIFAPHFPPDQPAKFANVHRVFGASNVAKLLKQLRPEQREDAVASLSYEAEARLRDPVHGCVGYIYLLQHKLKEVQHDLSNAKRELSTYIGPVAFGPNLPHQYHHQLQGVSPSPFEIRGMGIGTGLALSASATWPQGQMLIMSEQHQHQRQQMPEMHQAAVETPVAAREQEMFTSYPQIQGYDRMAGGAAVVATVSAQLFNSPSAAEQRHPQPQQYAERLWAKARGEGRSGANPSA
ncbi:unnamed protein product [Musa banksii]